MKLDKRNWKKLSLDEIADITSSKRIYYSEYVSKGIPFFRSKEIIDVFNKRDIKTELFIDTKRFDEIKEKFGTPRKDDLLLTAVGTIGVPYLVKEEEFYFKDGNLIWFRNLDKSRINSEYLYLWLQSNIGQEKIKSISTGTAQSALTIKGLKNLKIYIPNISEQLLIIGLFQSIDDSIEQTEEQEKNLRALAKRLIDGLINEQPTFGDLLKDKELAKVKFADVTNCIEQHERQPLDLGLTHFVGLENIEPENFRISTWGNIEDGTTFTKSFASGDVLFGKRRSYLKKVAIAEFDGICSSDILVFRAKENKMLADLLPFYAASESFIQYAVNTSAGSLSPRTKWRDLAKFELSIPDLETQSKILEVLQQIQTTIEQTIEQKETLKNLKFKLLNEILG